MFERESKENILDKMVRWSQAVSPKLTDFRRGSVINTIYEAIAGAIEGLYDRTYRSSKQVIETNLYAVIGFDKIQAVPSSGKVTFSRTTPATSDITIPAGTMLVAEPNVYRPPLTFYTVDDVILPQSYTTVDADVVCAEAGSITNIEANIITQFVNKPFGIDAVSNATAFVNGKDEETSEEQKVRFQDYMEARSTGSLQAVEYGAKQAYLTDAGGDITEQVRQSLAIEDTVNRPGEVDVYIWNGVGTPSASLQTQVQTVLKGYTDADGNKVYGYKIAGTKVNVYPANITYVKIKLDLTAETWAVLADVKATVEKEIATYFYRLQIGQPVLIADISAIAKSVYGVYDVKVQLSTDAGSTYNTNNIVPTSTTIVVNNSIVYGA